MALNHYLSFIILVPQICSAGYIQCKDTSDNLTITAQNKDVTTAFTENAVISALVNYPKDNLTCVQYITEDPPFSKTLQWIANCSYGSTINSINYAYLGINFEGTLFAESPIRKQQATDTVRVTVQVGTSIEDNSTPVIAVRENENFQLNCSAIGNPPPTLRWSLTNHEDNIEQDETFQTIPQFKYNTSSTVRLRICKVRYNNTGDYQCFGNNSVKDDSKVILQLSVHIPVELFNSSNSVNIIEGSSINISCEFRGFPNPQITWLNTSYNSTINIYDDIYSLSTLNIVSSKCDDEREFTCYASNTIVGIGMMNASGNVTITFQEPPKVQNLLAESDECNGTFMLISWDPVVHWSTDLTYQIQFTSDDTSDMKQTTDSQIIISTQPNTTYHISLVAVSGCNKISERVSTELHTGIYLPSEPLNVTSLQNAAVICTLKWSEPDITYNNISQYVIFYQACNRGSGCTGIQDVHFCDDLNCKINMTETNSEYHFEVAAENCAGLGQRSTSIGNCSTDSAEPANVNEITVSNSETNDFGTVEVSVTGFKVTIPDQSQTNGEISCYYIVMVRYGNLYNTSDQVQDRITIDPNNLTAIATASVEYVQDGQPYFAIASESPQTVFIGDDTKSSCSGLTRSLDYENFQSWNRNLTENRSYDMFLLTSVPSVKDESKMYTQSSTATFFNIPPVPVTTTTEQTTARPESPNDVPVAAIVVTIVVVILILVGVSIWFYKTKYKQRRKDNRYSENSTAHETLPMSATPEEHFDPLSDAIQPSTSNGISRIKSKIATAPPKPIMQPSYENIGFSFERDAVSSPTFVPFGNLHQKYIERRKNNDRLFSEEFKAIPTEIVDSSITSDVANLLENTKKNRYKNIKTYDKSRVVLSLLPNDPNSDYINASYIHGFSAKNKFIATQGPKSNTVKDFWRMVFEQRCLSIVMLTNIIEKGKNKCVQYWPDVVSGTKEFDCYSVDFLDEIISVDYVTRRFTLRDNANPDKYYTVTQYHFTTWPDHGVPNTTTGMLRFYHRVMKENPTDSGPILVHCSAGVGRTGTFIGIDILTEQMNVLSGVDFVKCIYDMRSQRPQMVQSMVRSVNLI